MSMTPSTEEVLNGSESGASQEALNVTASPDYDAEQSVKIFFWGELATALVVYSLTFVVGIIGNVLILVAIAGNRRMKSVTNTFLASLATADLTLICLCIPVKIAKLFSFTWTLGAFLCLGVHYVQTVTAICSVLTLTAISLERYYVILHPMKAQYICTKSQAHRTILAIWLLAFVLACPMLVAQVHIPVGIPPVAFWCVRNVDLPALWRFNELYLLVVLLLAPTAVMGTAYTCIIVEVWRVMKNRLQLTHQMPASKSFGEDRALVLDDTVKEPVQRCRSVEDQATLQQLIRMMVAVVVFFLVCWSPLLVFNALQSFGTFPVFVPGTYKHIRTSFELMAYANSCINPLVYGFMSRSFRDSFQRALCGQKYLLGMRRDASKSSNMTQLASLRQPNAAAMA
ncbi:gastrin/cholecystokinin type B receptor-like [Pollicipes pollicipes]|uniref:gastrin/cholecystokinin type B receptor-like n=1 Tax=Pollicipes pollicipes TaxID=41117 RepID=UPI001884FEBA|nr:gastrin/cholecystokinin type B receptor-like [Pollicipes pollicipes]